MAQLRRSGKGPVQRDLARAVGMDGPTMVGVLDRLEAQDFIVRRAAPHDRRAKCVFLTKAGRALLVRADSAILKVRRDLLNNVSHADMIAAMRVFSAIAGQSQALAEDAPRRNVPARNMVAADG